MLSIQTIPMPHRIGLQHIRPFELPTDLILEQWIIPAGTTVKVFQTANFGWISLPQDCKDKRGFVIPRRLFRY
jgi:hypothetical protein